jgi:hypothetical protein
LPPFTRAIPPSTGWNLPAFLNTSDATTSTAFSGASGSAPANNIGASMAANKRMANGGQAFMSEWNKRWMGCRLKSALWKSD